MTTKKDFDVKDRHKLEDSLVTATRIFF